MTKKELIKILDEEVKKNNEMFKSLKDKHLEPLFYVLKTRLITAFDYQSICYTTSSVEKIKEFIKKCYSSKNKHFEEVCNG